ncbi:MAG TPA: hypothetical protein VKC60_07145 [Opitutaceae bacterium]|nr:hypothetical protein [Opitutaceae bacterium]
MAEITPTFFSPDAEPWAELTQLYRRICVMRVNGRSIEANRLQSTELSTAIASAQQQHGAEVISDKKLQEIFQHERERVANASVLVELLLPELTKRLKLGSPASAETQNEPAQRFPVEDAPAAERSPPTAPPAIADLIDGMLSQERAESRSRPRRRAS